MTSSLRFASLGSVLLAASLFAAPARAGIEACGNIDVEASAECKVEIKEACVAKCQAVSFHAACEGQLETTCNKLPEVSCTGSCQADCSAECQVKPAEFDCEGSCTGKCGASCDGTCSGQCKSAANKTECEASCKGSCEATCTGECHGSCTGTPAEANCDAKCEASCKGSCKADLNMDCQVKGYAECEADLEGGCEVHCDEPEGAIFCNGEYVDHGGNARECIKALDDWLKAHVDVTASATGSSSCGAGKCTAQGEAHASASCSIPGVSSDRTTGAGWALVAGAFGLVAATRRRRR